MEYFQMDFGAKLTLKKSFDTCFPFKNNFFLLS